MRFDLDVIEDLFKKFWKENQGSFEYFIKANKVEPENTKIRGSIQLILGDYGEGFNYKVEIPHFDVSLDGLENRMKAELIIKVKAEMINNVPCEIIDSCRDNRIDLYKI